MFNRLRQIDATWDSVYLALYVDGVLTGRLWADLLDDVQSTTLNSPSR